MPAAQIDNLNDENDVRNDGITNLCPTKVRRRKTNNARRESDNLDTVLSTPSGLKRGGGRTFRSHF